MNHLVWFELKENSKNWHVKSEDGVVKSYEKVSFKRGTWPIESSPTGSLFVKATLIIESEGGKNVSLEF